MKGAFVRSLSLLLALLLTVPLFACHSEAPKVQQGVLDLRNWDFARDGRVELSGSWAFYWHKLYSAQDFKNAQPKADAYLEIPGYWTSLQKDGHSLPPHGFATLHLRLLLPPNMPLLAIRVGPQRSRYRLFIDEHDLGHVGRPGKNDRDQHRLGESMLVTFSARGRSVVDVILHVANGKSLRAGIDRPLLLGQAEDLARRHTQWLISDGAMMGALLLFGIYFILFFLFRQRHHAPLYLGMMCLLFGLDARAIAPEFKFQVQL